MVRFALGLGFALCLAAQPAHAIDTSLQLVLDLPGNAERNVVPYQCEGLEPFSVEYVNANPIFLAFVPVNGETLIFVNVLSASGARYASGQYVWWTEGGQADLYDETLGEDAEPIACLEATETP
jgi:membrane-bound inhibitor of C-type lysozyme